MSKVADLHEEWSRDPEYREAYERLGPEFELSRSVIEARTNAGLTRTCQANANDAVSRRSTREWPDKAFHEDAREDRSGDGHPASD